MNAKESINHLAQNIVEQIKRKKSPSVQVPVRSLSNVFFDPIEKTVKIKDSSSSRTFFNVNHVRKFVQTIAVAKVARRLIEKNIHTNLRAIYYQLKRTLPNTTINLVGEEQAESDNAIEDLEAITGLSRELLHINAKASGMVSGKVVIEDLGDTIDWSRMGSGGWAIPSNVENIKFKKVDAKFVLYVEKDAVWARLHEDRFWEKHACITMASQGQATRGIRRLLIRLSEEWKLPIYVMTDFDPWGFYIYSVLKYGSINLAMQSDTLVVRGARFLGLSADDIQKYKLQKHFIKFKDVDVSRLTQLENYDWFKNNASWQRQFKLMRSFKAKAEIQSLDMHDIQFITKTYLPEKLKSQDVIE